MSAPTFTFTTNTYPSGFIVVKFRGEEKISHLFQYKIDVKVAIGTVIDDAIMLGDNATFTFVSNIGTIQDVEVSGIVATFEYLSTGANYDNYRVTLVPEAWNESLGVDYQIFLNKTPKQIIDEEIADAGIDAVTAAVSINHAAREFTCQYNESNIAFISRIAEHYGMYYYFDYSDNSKIIFADDDAYPAGDSNALVFDDAVGGVNFFNRIKRFRKNTYGAVAQVIVTGSNPDQPSAVIIGRAGDTTAPTGNTLRLVEEDVVDSDEAQRIADIRFEDVQAKSTVFNGKSGAIQLRPGFTFDLSGHPRDGAGGGADFNDTYLVTGILHEGKNLDQSYSDASSSFYYRNSFKAIRSSVQFRPGKITPKPRATSTLGRVYSEVFNPRLAERNEKGEYRVKFDFLDHETNAQPSSWLRMATPAAGTEDAIDIPLKGGVEVHISFANGNPDRPFIQNALPNAQFPAHVTDSNLNHALIATDGLLALKSSGGYHLNVKTENDTVRDTADDFRFPTLNATNHTLENPLTIEQEMSGDYLVDRAYGVEYEYRHGDSFRYLNNESEYVIGTGYIEQHVTDKSDNLITYASIDTTVLGTWEVPDAFKTIVDANDPTNKSVPGLVEKTWGDVYEFHHGTTRSWSECAASPNGGGRAINYGTGFTLNFLNESASEVVLNPVHAVDVEEEFKKAEENQAENQDFIGKAASAIKLTDLGKVISGVLMDIFNPGIKKHISDAWENGEVAVNNQHYKDITKTIGNTYDYHNGDELNVHIGETIEIVYGDSSTLIKGNSFEQFDGDSGWYFNGGHEDFIIGGSKSFHMGYKMDNFMGVVEEVLLGGHLNIELSAGKEISATSQSRLDNKKDRIAAKQATAALSDAYNSLSQTINAVNYKSTAVDWSSMSTTFKVTAGTINLNAPVIQQQGAIVKLG